MRGLLGLRRLAFAALAIGALVGTVAGAAAGGWQPGDHTLAGFQLYVVNDTPGWTGSITCTPLPSNQQRIDVSGGMVSDQAPFAGPASVSFSSTARHTR